MEDSTAIQTANATDALLCVIWISRFLFLCFVLFGVLFWGYFPSTQRYFVAFLSCAASVFNGSSVTCFFSRQVGLLLPFLTEIKKIFSSLRLCRNVKEADDKRTLKRMRSEMRVNLNEIFLTLKSPRAA